MKLFINIFITILITLLIINCSGENEKKLFFRVTRIVDGDTFWVVDEALNRQKVRLIGIDTPELKHGNEPEEFYAQAAKEFLIDLIADREIRLEFDQEHTDKYGRTLAYAYVDDTVFVNKTLVQKGYAHKLPIPPNTKYATLFTQQERLAKSLKLGIWQQP